MPEPRVQIKFHPNNLLALTQARLFVENQIILSGLEVRKRDFDWIGDVQNGVTVSFRIPNKDAAEQFEQSIRSSILQLSSRGTGIISFHLCSHDDKEVFSCRDPKAEYRERRF